MCEKVSSADARPFISLKNNTNVLLIFQSFHSRNRQPRTNKKNYFFEKQNGVYMVTS